MQNNFTYFRNKAIPKYKQFNYQLASSYSNKCLLRGLKTNYVAASVCAKHLLKIESNLLLLSNANKCIVYLSIYLHEFDMFYTELKNRIHKNKKLTNLYKIINRYLNKLEWIIHKSYLFLSFF